VLPAIGSSDCKCRLLFLKACCLRFIAFLLSLTRDRKEGGVRCMNV
ncbi:MAG: hypothetical protein ACI9XB_003401, partial [Gammaproteobacteria bacterium]